MRLLIGVILVAIGVVALLNKLGVISGSIWSYVWPVILIILGLSFLFRRHRTSFWCGPWHYGPEERDKT